MRRPAAALALAGSLAAAAPALGADAALRPSTDFYVSARDPVVNHGADSRLVVSRRMRSVGFVRFTLAAPPAPGVHAVLWLYALRGASSGLTVRHASDGPWTPRSAPRTDARAVQTGPLPARRWTAVDVTSLTTRKPAVSLALIASGARPAVLSSREGGVTAPRLTLVRVAPARPVAPAVATSSLVQPLVPIPPPSPPPLPAGPQPSSAPACGVSTAPAVWRHVVWIVMENHSYGQAMGTPSTPYTNALAARCGVATDYWAEARPSLPNYIAMTSGSTQGITDDSAPAVHPLAVPSIFSQLSNDWRSLQESMPGNCAQASAGDYAVKHNPAAYYTNVRDACNTLDVPMADPIDVSARFTFITPNLCNDTHDCSTQVGDAFLARTVTRILDSPEYRSGTTAVFLTWDEGAGDQHIATIVVAPSTPPGTADGTRYDHYSLLRTTEEMLGLPVVLGGATQAPSMRSAFGL